jgi:hypothetical protein
VQTRASIRDLSDRLCSVYRDANEENVRHSISEEDMVEDMDMLSALKIEIEDMRGIRTTDLQMAEIIT